MRLLKLACVMFLALFVCSAACATAPPPKVKVLIVTGFDVKAHKWEEAYGDVEAILKGSPRFDVTGSKDKESFKSLAGNDVVVLCYGFWDEPDPSDEAKKGLLDYVKNGGNLVSLHFACASFQEWKEYHELLGRVWKKGVGGHGPYGKFTVNIKNAEHPITKGMKDFEIEDELYAKLTGDAKIEVLASADSDWSKQTEPMIFTKSYGKGRVVQDVLGHDATTRKNPNYQELLRRCVEWAATGNVIAKK